MASLLRQIVAGPRSRHPEAGLDMCYVTDRIVATSGPSDTYPQRAYRNPLDSLVKWLDSKHGEDWAIWEFRAEGTGYPDSAVYNRIYHYPFPDHHPPPFALIPNIMASMRNWLHEKEQRVAVLHCKAGKGRSGTVSCSYLISEEGWEVDKALKRFTERRMRPGMGKGISIPSQLRWIGYVNRWTKHGKIYVERQVEVLEIHCWGLRDGVKIQVEGFVDGGKKIKTFHTFTRAEREIVRGTIEKSGGIASVVSEVLGTAGLGKVQSTMASEVSSMPSKQGLPTSACTHPQNEAGCMDCPAPKAEQEDLGKGDVVFRPSKRVVLPTNDFNIDVERRNQTAFDLTYVTAVAHVWANAFFEGNGPEQGGSADVSGVFEISWDAMDGIKGSSRKGIPAFDKIAVVWKTLTLEGKPGILIKEPAEGEEVPQSSPANWKGQKNVEPSENKDLGLRKSSPVESTTDLSNTSIIKSNNNQEGTSWVSDLPQHSTESVRCPGSSGENLIERPSSVKGNPAQTPASASDLQHGVGKRNSHFFTEDLPGGKPENEMQDSKEHTLLHVGRHRWDSS